MTGKLYRSKEWETCWKSVVRPWFESRLSDAASSRKPSYVLVPSPAWGHDIRSRLTRASTGVIGVEILIPATLRARMMEALLPDSALLDRETGQLFLSSVSREGGARIANSVAVEPSSLWSELERCGSLSEKPEKIFENSVSKIICKAADLWRKSGFTPQWEVDRSLLKQGRELFQNILILGFDSRDWNLWNLLRAAVHVSENATVCLVNPQDAEGRGGIVWHNSWEAQLGVCEECGDEYERYPFDPIAQRLSGMTENKLDGRISFFVAKGTVPQAEVAVQQSVCALAGGSAESIGIVVPGRGGLAREISVLLNSLRIPHFDVFGHPSPTLPDIDAWRSFLEWMSQPSITQFLKFAANEPDIFLKWGLSTDQMRRSAEGCLTEYLLDDFAVWKECLLQDPNKDMGEKLRGIRILPERAKLGEFCEVMASNMEYLSWDARAKSLRRLLDRYSKMLFLECWREDFLRWLAEIEDGYRSLRYESGANPFAKVHIVSYQDAVLKSWDYLVLAGQNQGVWPPLHEKVLWLDSERIKAHNTSAIQEGKHGLGDDIVREGMGLYLDPLVERAVLDQLPHILLGNAKKGVSVAWSIFEAGEADKELLPSDFVGKAYLAQYGHPLEAGDIWKIAQKTEEWMHRTRLALPLPAVLEVDEMLQRVKVAFHARREEGVCGGFEFALEKPPQKPLRIACKKFESFIKNPALVWLELVLGVSPTDEWSVLNSWNKTKGTWVHRWLHRGLNPRGLEGWFPMLSSREFASGVSQEAVADRKSRQAFLEALGKRLPRYWECVYMESERIARDLSEHFGDNHKTWTHAHTEWDLPKDLCYTTESGKNLYLKGRMDLLLSKGEPSTSVAMPENLWLIDYKTGTRVEKLSKKKFLEGAGLQIALYLLSLSALGAKSAGAALSRFQQELLEEVSMEDCLGLQDLWDTLARVEETGIMGMRKPGNPKYSFAPALPMATLYPDEDFLEEKWVSTHGGVLK